jgi:uncharacterized membrane protein
MSSERYLRLSLILSAGGTAFSGYLSAVKFFSKTCAFNEGCPYFLGYPACYFGFALFVTLLVIAGVANMQALTSRAAKQATMAVSAAGVIFSGSFVIQEIGLWMAGTAPRYTLLLPTCAYGLVFYAAMLVIAALSYKGTASHDWKPIR